MERSRVSSSNIASIGYDNMTQVLEVEFLNGSIYQYRGVPRQVFEGLMSAPSHGSFLDTFVKKAGYPYARVS